MGDEAKVDTKKHPTDIDREIGRRIKARRAELGLNQQSLALQIGVSYQQVQKYENGTDRIGASRLYAIANALRCDIGDFFEPDPGQMRDGDEGYDAARDAHRLLATEDGRVLVRAFLAFDDTVVRRKFVELAGAFASGRRPGGVRRGRRPRGEA